MMRFTTSWDDGDARDMRVADLLDRYGIKGTFYIARDQKDRLTEEQMRVLATRHEIGAHTLTHPDLRTLDEEGKRVEIAGSKEWLEGVIGKPVEMFCYPYGRFDDDAKRIVEESGFKGARSSVKTLGTIPNDAYALPVTMMTYRAPYSLKEKVLLPFMRAALANKDWEALAYNKFDVIEKEGGVFHLWGHSWEIDRLGLWKSLDGFLDFIARRTGVHHLTNSELIVSSQL